MHHKPKYTFIHGIRPALILLICLLLHQASAYGQDSKAIIKRIDSLAALGLPKSALAETERLTQVAFKNTDQLLLIRSVIYRNKFLAATQEGALSVIIDRLQKDIPKATYPAKPILHSLLGSVYWKYFQQRRSGIYGHPTLPSPGTDMAKWGPGNFFKEMDKQFGLAMADAARAQQTPAGTLDGLLEGDSTTRYLRPTLYDLLLARSLDFYTLDESSIMQTRQPFDMTDTGLFGDSRSFTQLKIPATDTTANLYKAFKYMQQATAFHLSKGNREALAELDLRRLAFLYRHSRSDLKDSLYLKGLNIVAAQTQLKVSGDALAMIGKFYHDKNELVKAVDNYQRAISRDSAGLAAKNAIGHIKAIKNPFMDVEMDNPHAPGRPLLASLNYTNVAAVQLKFYKLTQADHGRFTNLPRPEWNNDHGRREQLAKLLSDLKPMRSQIVALPDLHDYKRHRTEFKIDPLEKGYYLVAVSFANDTTAPNIFTLRISAINYLVRNQPDGKMGILVADRTSGKPMAGARVAVNGESYLTDKNGSAILPIDRDKYNLMIRTAGDSLPVVQRPNDDSDWPDPDRPIPKTVIFTDRVIYRPGQTVYFKGIRMQSVNNYNTVVPGYKATLTAKLNAQMDVAAIPVVANEFGTFEGSFALPNTATGTVGITDGKYDVISVQVAEYKRPKFELSMDRLRGNYRPNDSISVTGTVNTYAGYGISKAKVVINIGREVKARTYALDLKYQYQLERLRFNFQIDDTVTTDEQGRFRYTFKANQLSNYDPADVVYTYKVSATAIDGNNETHRATGSAVVAMNGLAMTADRIQKTIYYSGDALNYKVWLTDMGGAPVAGLVTATAYSLKKPQQRLISKTRWYQYPDTFVMDSVTFKKHFPQYAYKRNERSIYLPIDNTIGDSKANADSLRGANLDLAMLKGQPSGTYRIVFKSRSVRGDTASLSRDIIWYDKPSVPLDLFWVTNIPLGDSMPNIKRFYVGNGKPSYVFVESFDGPKQVSAKWMRLPGGKQQVMDLPAAMGDRQLAYQFTMMCDNRAEPVYFPADGERKNERLNVKLLSFRDKLLPGAKEQWKLQIRDKDGRPISAELAAVMYDASLDGLAGPYGGGYENNWNRKLEDNYGTTYYYRWAYPDDDHKKSNIYLSGSNAGRFWGITRHHEGLKLFAYDFGENKPIETIKLNGKVVMPEAGRITYYNEDQNDIFMEPDKIEKYMMVMKETVVRGNFGYSVVRHELSTPPGQRYFKADNTEHRSGIFQIPNVAPRTNFNETAFFYPRLYPDVNGNVDVNFTIPQSLTKWRFQAFAHTKDMATGYVNQYVYTQKQLSVSAGMPRFFRSGDTITVAARVANLTSNKLDGRVLMQFFNGLTDQPINIFADPKASEQPFGLDSLSNRSLNFKLIIPKGLEALKYRISASSGDFTDAEENTLLVLSKQVLVTTSMPMMVRPGERKSFTMDALAAKHGPTLKSKMLTLEYTTNTAWSAIQALPTLADVADDSPEQLFSRYFANGLATHIVSKQPAIKQIFDRWRSAGSSALLSNLDKNKELKSTLLEASPWLTDATTETGQKQRLALLFDVNQMSYDRQITLNKLAAKQLADGGFAWFGGNVADSYITRYILAGMGQLSKAGVSDEPNKQALKTIADKAIKYSDTLLVRGFKDNSRGGNIISAGELHAWYARSYFAYVPMGAEQKNILTERLKLAERQWLGKSKYEQGLIAMIMLRSGKPEVAQKIVRSLMETAQTSADMGMYWIDNRSGYYWYQAPIETQCLLIELFSEIGGHDKAVDEMKLWLIRNKQANSWRSTKATAAACFALLINGSTSLNTSTDTKISIGGAELTTLKPDVKVEAGTGYLKTTWTDGQIKPTMAKVDINNPGRSVGLGALHWQYLEDADKVKPSQSGLQLDRKYFIVTKDGPVAVDAKHQPKPGDLLKVVLYVKADRDMDYIHMKDNRPAGTEPVDVLSAYKYLGGLYYYTVTRDLSTNFYISRLTKGSHVFEYEVRAAQPGNYSAGVSIVQSMYAPEFNATVGSQRLNVVAK